MRTPSTIIYKRGEVVLPFPYTDHSGFKRRPAVILSANAYNLRRDDLIVAPITSNVIGRQPDDTLLSNWSAAGLVKPSVVKGILGSIEQRLVLRKMGTLSASDLKRAERMFAAILEL
jgi:mRNA interferase MazF